MDVIHTEEQTQSQNTTNTSVDQECYSTCGVCSCVINMSEHTTYVSHTIFDDNINSVVKHTYCSVCINSSTKAKLETNAVSLRCFNFKCEHIFPKNEIIKCLDCVTSKRFNELIEIKEMQEIASSLIDFQVCPFCKIFGCVINNATKSCKCNKCLKSWCTGCKMEAHDGYKCWVFPLGTSEETIAAKITYVVSTYSQFNCPACSTIIEKTDGCNHMTCTTCTAESCYECDKLYIKKDTWGEIALVKNCECGTIATSYIEHNKKIKMNKKKVINMCKEISAKNDKRTKKIIKNTLKQHDYELSKRWFPNLSIKRLKQFFNMQSI